LRETCPHSVRSRRHVRPVAKFNGRSYAPQMQLRHLQVGSADTGRDLDAWLATPGAATRWRLPHFGGEVAAGEVRPADGHRDRRAST
jgi:hypothetical protein